MKHTIILALFALAPACAPDAVGDGPDYDGEILDLGSGGGKADGPGREVTARARTSGFRDGDENLTCYDTAYEIEVTYVNESLPWGVTVELVSALSGAIWWTEEIENTQHYEEFEWRYQERVDAEAVDAWTWRAARDQAAFPGGGGFESLHFALRLRYPDGSVRWDNGGSTWGYYEIDLPGAPCEVGWVPFQETTPTTWIDAAVGVVYK